MKLEKSYECGVDHKITWVSAAHIPRTENTEADSFSRNFNEPIEWKLNTHLFKKISSMFGNPTLELFASRINHQSPSN